MRRGPRVCPCVAHDYPDIINALHNGECVGRVQMEECFASGIVFFLNRAGVYGACRDALLSDCFDAICSHVKNDRHFQPQNLPRLVLTIAKSAASRVTESSIKPRNSARAKDALDRIDELVQAPAVACYNIDELTAALRNDRGKH